MILWQGSQQLQQVPTTPNTLTNGYSQKSSSPLNRSQIWRKTENYPLSCSTYTTCIAPRAGLVYREHPNHSTHGEKGSSYIQEFIVHECSYNTKTLGKCSAL